MARKRSPKGRSKSFARPTLISSLFEVNKRLRKLERAGMSKQYSIKKLVQRFEDETEYVTFNRRRRNKFRLKRKPNNMAKIRLYQKNLQQFIKSVTSTPEGVRTARQETKGKLKSTLSKLTDKDIEDEDLDEFYDLFTDPDYKYISERIPPSDLYVLIQEARSESWSQEQFVNQISTLANSNNADLRTRAERLYNKYIR